MIKFTTILFILLALPLYGNKDLVTVSVSSVEWRKEGLKKTLESVINQVDHVNVFLQDYRSVPDFLDHHKITIALGEEYPEVWSKGAGAKFFWADQVHGYHFIIDDDILYPPDYVQYCIEKIEYYQRKAVVGFHGSIFKPIIENYIESKDRFWFIEKLANDQFVHLLGTGLLAYHTDTISVSVDDFIYRNMADLQFALLAQKQQVPLICLSRTDGYIKEIQSLSRDPKSLWVQEKSNNLRTMIAQKHNWMIYSFEQG
jgi:hypothetical protein